MASFSTRKVDGRYYARIAEKGRSPKRKSWPLKTTQKITAQKRLNRLRNAFDRGDWDPWEGGWLAPEPVALKEAVSQFLNAKDNLRPRTLDTYQGILRRFWESVPPGIMLQDVELSDLEDYIHASNVTNATSRKRFRHLRAFFNWTVEADHLEASPLDERIHFHSLRHTTGSWLSMRGVPMRHIQSILGHSDRNVTEKYSHLAPETLDRAMEETFGSDDGER